MYYTVPTYGTGVMCNTSKRRQHGLYSVNTLVATTIIIIYSQLTQSRDANGL